MLTDGRTDGRTTDGRTTDGRTTDAGVTGILIAHLRAFGSGELKSQQQQNHRLRADSSLSHRGGGGLIAFYWYQIFALDSAVVEVQEMFSSHGGHLTNAMYHLEFLSLKGGCTCLSESTLVKMPYCWK